MRGTRIERRLTALEQRWGGSAKAVQVVLRRRGMTEPEVASAITEARRAAPQGRVIVVHFVRPAERNGLY